MRLVEFEPRAHSLRKNLSDLPKYINATSLSYAFVAWIFATSGPLLIILNAARIGHLSPAAVESWIFASYGIGGAMTIALSLLYRQPIAAAWSIAGAVLVGGFLARHGLDVAVGVYFLAGVVSVALGATGAFKYVLSKIPLPVILGMVSGILLPFGVSVITASEAAPTYAGGATLSYLLAGSMKSLSRRLPPILWAIVVGGGIAALEGEVQWDVIELRVVEPMLIAPTFDITAIAELLIPLTLTMIAVQDAQTFAILRSVGYAKTPVNSVVTATGVGTLAGAFLGSHSYCTAPVMTGIVSNKQAAPLEGAYAPTVVIGILLVAFALLAPLAAATVTAFPTELIQVLSGLALIPVLSQSFAHAFGGHFRIGALAAFMITVSQIEFLNIGAPFWGMVLGALVALVLERRDFAAAGHTSQRTPQERKL